MQQIYMSLLYERKGPLRSVCTVPLPEDRPRSFGGTKYSRLVLPNACPQSVVPIQATDSTVEGEEKFLSSACYARE